MKRIGPAVGETTGPLLPSGSLDHIEEPADFRLEPVARVRERLHMARSTLPATHEASPQSPKPHLSWSATFSIPAFAQASSFGCPPTAPLRPTPPIVSSPTLIGIPPPSGITSASIRCPALAV